MAARDFDDIAGSGPSNDLASMVDEDMEETTLPSPRRSIGAVIGTVVSDDSSRKYSPSEDETPSKATPLEVKMASSKEVKQPTDNKCASAGKHSICDQSALRDHRVQFHELPGAEEREIPFEQANDNDGDGEDADGEYQLVKKSIYKPPKKGSILQRLAGIAGGGSKAKYVVPPRDPDVVQATTRRLDESVRGHDCEEKGSGSTLEDVELDDSTQFDETNSAIVVEDEENESIDVAIDHSVDQGTSEGLTHEVTDSSSPLKDAQHQQHDQTDGNAYSDSPLAMEHAPLQDPPQVVIHSGESDSESGFATLNPVIAAKRKLHGSTQFATVTTADASPFLVEIPKTLSASADKSGGAISTPSSLLVINALGASGMLKVEKFGTQSTLLELQLCSRDRELNRSTQSSIMRTSLHKKGGSEAQWNQQFTVALESKQEQIILVTVKTNNRMVVGEAEVLLDKVGDLFYDQHYPLYRPDEDATDDASALPSDPSSELKLGSPVGYVHLQLKIVDSETGHASPIAVPRLHLPFPTASAPIPESTPQSSTVKGSIPRILANGGLLYKVPYHNSSIVGYAAIPRRVWVTVVEGDRGDRLITWTDPTASAPSTSKKSSGGVRNLSLSLVTEIREGRRTKAFEAHKASNAVQETEKCFSLVTRTRTLDLVAASKEEATIWVAGLRELLFPTTAVSASDASMVSARKIDDFRLVALSSGRSNTVAAADPVKKKQQHGVWRSQIFDLARRDRINAIASCLVDGCPIDLLETGSGDTLLIIACRVGNAPLVELCLSWRAKNDPHPEFGDTALQVAVAHQHADCLKLLLLTAAKSDMDSEIVNHIDSNSDAPLHVASRNGDFACLQHLLLHGADICVVDEIGRTPLHCAVSTAQQGGADCVAYLLDVGGDSVLNLGDHEGDTPLHYAALAGNEGAVKVLLESAADALAVNSNGETPFDVAIRERHQGCADLIAPYCTNSHEDSSSEPPRSGRTSIGVNPDCEEVRRAQSDEEREDESNSHRLHRRRRHHHRHVRELDESNSDNDSEGLSVSNSSSDPDTAYDSCGYSSTHSPTSRSLSNEHLQRPWSAIDRAYDLDRDERRPHRSVETPSVWLDSHRQGVVTLSPSEQVRAALARHQRSFSVVSGGARPPMSARSACDGTPKRNMSLSTASSSRYYPVTARESSPPRSEQQPLYWVNGRQVTTESVDFDWGPASLPKQGQRHLSHDNGREFSAGQGFNAYQGFSSRSRSRSEDTSGLSWGYRSNSQAWCDHRSRLSSDTGNCSTNAWAGEAYTNTPADQDQWARRPATAGSVSSSPLWDLLYTEDGYPYYVNRQTGISQWEKPPDAEIALPLAHTSSPAVNSTRGPDEIIRMRLAQARRQQSMPTAASRASQFILSCVEEAHSAEEARSRNAQCHESSATSMRSIELAGASLPTTIAANFGADGEVQQIGPTASISSGEEPTLTPVAQELLQTTFENRTGLKLSIDISSPPSKERRCLCRLPARLNDHTHTCCCGFVHRHSSCVRTISTIQKRRDTHQLGASRPGRYQRDNQARRGQLSEGEIARTE
jgi:ankyrin repeat protein